MCVCMLARGEPGERGSRGGSSYLLRLLLCCQGCPLLLIRVCPSLFLLLFLRSLLPFHLTPSYLLHPLSCDFLSSFFLLSSPFLRFSLLHPSSISKEAVSKIEEGQRVFVYSCCFTVSAPLFLKSDSRFILSKTTEVFHIKPPIAVVKVTLSP